ncbi:AaceriAER150Wp [[Ashbya] aceris (nom. inval.)]|nr:AaceriAER150Wp [[Ashbya] aceris (nom. inval.)]
MSELLPMATYNLNIEPYSPTPAIDVTVPVTVRLTMAAIDPESLDDEKKPATLRLIRRNPAFDDEDDLLGDSEDEEEESEEESEDEEPEAKKPKKKSAKAESEEEDSEEEDSEEEDSDDEFEEFVLATLSPESQYQQTLDLVISPEEEVQFVVTGSYRVSLSGNYVQHPYDDEDSYDEEHEGCGDDCECDDDSDYDLTPDEEDILDMEDASDVEAKIEELVEQEEANEKRKADEDEPKPAKKQKKDAKKDQKDAKKDQKDAKKDQKDAKKDAKKEKKVEFKKDLEEGPSKKKDDKPKTKILEGGIVVEDRVVGSGKAAKKGARVGMRYIGKLKNGKVFDKNTSGKPFVFKLGHGEVIKGWDIGVAGMAVGGERRIVIPAAYAYGKQALPGIPANSELTFDVKLVSLK